MMDKYIVEQLSQLDHSCIDYIIENGSVLVKYKVEKALYVCKSSGLLWYKIPHPIESHPAEVEAVISVLVQTA